MPLQAFSLHFVEFLVNLQMLKTYHLITSQIFIDLTQIKVLPLKYQQNRLNLSGKQEVWFWGSSTGEWMVDFIYPVPLPKLDSKPQPTTLGTDSYFGLVVSSTTEAICRLQQLDIYFFTYVYRVPLLKQT